MFDYHFVNPDLEVEIFFQKERKQKMGMCWFWNRGLRYLRTRVLGLKKIAELASFFTAFYVIQKNNGIYLDRYLHPFIIQFFKIQFLLSCGSELRKRYRLKLLMMSLEAEGGDFWKLSFLEGKWIIWGKGLLWGVGGNYDISTRGRVLFWIYPLNRKLYDRESRLTFRYGHW